MNCKLCGGFIPQDKIHLCLITDNDEAICTECVEEAEENNGETNPPPNK